MSKFISKFTPKLNDESRMYACAMLASDYTAVDIAKMIKKKFDIEVTSARIGTLIDTNKACARYYQEARQAYLLKLNDLTDIAIHAKRTRLQDADKIRLKLLNIMDKVEQKLDTKNPDGSVIPLVKDDLKYMRELGNIIGIHLRTLKYAKEESEDIVDQSKKQAQPSLVQYIEKMQVNVDKQVDVNEDINKDSLGKDEKQTKEDNTENITP